MLKWSLAAIAAVVVIFLVVVAMQPSDFKVERSATLRAPAPAAFAQVNDFHNWRAWSPWEKVDPALKRQYEGPSAGPGELVRIRLEFFKPFAATNTAEFNFTPAGGDATAVTWTMTGRQGLTQMKTVVERRP